MAETHLSPSNILLFGRVLNDLKINQVKVKDGSPDRHTPFTVPREGANRELEQQLAAPEAKVPEYMHLVTRAHTPICRDHASFLSTGPESQSQILQLQETIHMWHVRRASLL